MFKPGSILLTSGGQEHLDLLRDTFTDLSVSIVNPADLADLPLDATTWLFVDWLLPAMAGLMVLNRLRRAHPGKGPGQQATVTMVLPEDADRHASDNTGGDTGDLRARALAAGADDYILGPLSPQALVERVRIYFGSSGASRTDHSDGAATPAPLAGANLLCAGGLTLDPQRHLARYDGRAITLKQIEFRLLSHFMSCPDRIFSRSDLIAQLGRADQINADRTVDAWISDLRRSLKRQRVSVMLRTVRGRGYILDSR